MKYRSLIGRQMVTFFGKKGMYEITITENVIGIFSDKALEDAIKFGIIEEVKPRQMYAIQFSKDDYMFRVFDSEKQAQDYLVKSQYSFSGKIKKFIEVI